jgi:hypothetical protein
LQLVVGAEQPGCNIPVQILIIVGRRNQAQRLVGMLQASRFPRRVKRRALECRPGARRSFGRNGAGWHSVRVYDTETDADPVKLR